MRNKKAILTKIFVLLLLCLGHGWQMTYAVDTYATFEKGFSYAAKDMLYRNGRPVIALMYKIFSMTHIRNDYFYYISYALAFILLLLAIYLYEIVLKDYIKDENTRIVCSFLVVCNAYIIEYFMFIEQSGFMLAIFFNVVAVFYINKYISEQNNKYITYAIGAALVSILTYQGTVALFFIMCLPIIYNKAKNIIDYIKLFGVLVTVYMIPAIIEIILFKIVFDNNRNSIHMTDFEGKAAQLNKAIYALYEAYTHSYGLFPRFSYLILFILLAFLSLILIVKKQDVNGILNLFMIVSVVNILPIAPIIVSSGWGCPRILYPLASGVAILIVNYYTNIQDENDTSSWYSVKRIFFALAALLLIFEYKAFISIYTDKYRANYADKTRILEIGEAIKEYEASTGNIITTVAFYCDANHDEQYYSDLNSYSDLVVSSFHNWDSQLAALNYYLGTNYKRIGADAGYEVYFANFDWHCYSPMQMVFDNDTLHYCVY